MSDEPSDEPSDEASHEAKYIEVVWVTHADLNDEELAAFSGPEVALGLQGDLIDTSNTNAMRRVKVGHRYYYLKHYFRPGKYLRRFLGRSRVTREWHNARWFQRNNISTPRCVAYGEGNRYFGAYWGIIILQEVAQAHDLQHIYQGCKVKFNNRLWRAKVSFRLAGLVRQIHALGFIHNDLEWRNLLVSVGDLPEVFVIDCPAGRQIYLKGNRRGIVRDLALLDKMGRQVLSRTERLKFYLLYKQIETLSMQDKREVRRIIRFFSSRTKRDGKNR